MSAALRAGSTVLSAVLLVAVNAIRVIGVAFWGWSLMLILVLYAALYRSVRASRTIRPCSTW